MCSGRLAARDWRAGRGVPRPAWELSRGGSASGRQEFAPSSRNDLRSPHHSYLASRCPLTRGTSSGGLMSNFSTHRLAIVGTLASTALVVSGVVVAGGAAAASPGSSTGPSSSDAPYLVRHVPGMTFTSLLTAGDSVGDYRMAGTPDGLGAFDNGDGTFTVLMNHEFGRSVSIPRSHGNTSGAFVSRWVVDS